MDNNDIVIIDLDRPRQLRLTHRVLKRFMAKKKVSMADFDKAVESYSGMTELICEMLKAEEPALTEEQCDDLLDMVPIQIILEKGAEAIKAGFGIKEEKAEEVDSKNPTGRT